jgi:hypothetical protein
MYSLKYVPTERWKFWRRAHWTILRPSGMPVGVRIKPKDLNAAQILCNELNSLWQRSGMLHSRDPL